MESIKLISSIIDEMLKKIPRQRDYNGVFEKVSKLLIEKHYYNVRPMDLRFHFTLFMQEEFDAIPKELWKINDCSWLAEKEYKAKEKLLKWIEQEIVK